MARTRNGGGFTALRVEGGILPPEFLTEVAALSAPRQSGTDYGLSKSLSLKDEIARYWRIGNDLHARYAERRPRTALPPSRVGVDDWLVPLLRSLGYEDLAMAGSVELEDRVFKLTHRACGGAVPLLLVTRDFDLDKPDPRLGGNGRRPAPHGMMQEYLNAEAGALWGMVSNGSRIRILRDNPSLTRPSYIEADLDLIFAEELYPDFAALWLAAHASRFAPADDNPSNCIIETWRAKAHETGERARENLRDGVTAALRRLGNGFLGYPDNGELRQAIQGGRLSPDDYYQQLLRLVYRMLFLFTAEERELLHAPESGDRERGVYEEGYALTRLRDRALRRRNYDRNADLWQGLQITFRALARGAPGLGLSALGGLFRHDHCPDLDSAAIANEHLLEAVRTLAYFPSPAGKSLARINYRDMDTEELGSVYESLLELHPAIDVHAAPWRFAFAGDNSGDGKAKGSARKLSGSYYTPPSLVGELVRSTLDPVIRRTLAEHPEDPAAAVLRLRVIDPACESGHFLLAAARRLAAEIARIEADDDGYDEGKRRHALREVVRHCIYGVDRNPLAVELCRTALWIESIEPGKPLTFLDAHIAFGDSLIGVLDPDILAEGIPAAAYKPLTGDDKGVCTDLKKRNRERGQGDLFDEEAVLEVAMTSIDLDAMPEDTLADVEAKEFAWEAARSHEDRAREALKADLFAGAFFAAKTQRTLKTVPVSDDLLSGGSDTLGRAGVEPEARKLSVRHRFLHWHLAFPEIMQDGGFDAVLANPPWERIKLQEKEFFETRSPKIAAARNKAARKRLIQNLNRADASDAERSLYRAFNRARREAEAASQFVRTGGRFPLTGTGDVNTYAVFAETCLRLVNPRGRAGLIVPTGIATDHSTRKFFEHVVADRRLATLYDFENREAVFPGVHRSYKFCLLTLAGRDDPVPEAEYAFFLHQIEHLKERERRFTLAAEDFRLFNPNTRTCPIFRTRRDMEIARKMYRRAGVFWKEAREGQPEENPWGVKFSTMFHMSNDSGLFRTRTSLEDAGWALGGNVFVHEDHDGRYLPLYEAKLFHQYDHRFATFDGVSDKDVRNGRARPMTAEEKAHPESVVLPRYWVPATEVAKRLDKSVGVRNDPVSLTGDRGPGGHSTLSRDWLSARSPENHAGDRRAHGSLHGDPNPRAERFRDDHRVWLVVFRDIARATDQRTTIFATIPGTAVNNKGPLLRVEPNAWLQALRGITTATNERTVITTGLSPIGFGHSAALVDYRMSPAVATALVAANMNSIPLDWSARLSVGGVNMSFFIVKQLPVLPPDAYLEDAGADRRYVELIVPRVLELIYTGDELEGFAADLGYSGPPFPWDEPRRHRLQCELDAVFARMYQLERSDLEWILDSPSPGTSFPSLKQHEIKRFGEYRTQRLVLEAFELLSKGKNLVSRPLARLAAGDGPA